MATNLNAARQASAYFIRQRQRGRQFANALTVHAAGLTVVGADQFDGKYLTGAMFVQSEIDGLPWVALTSGVTGAEPLSGNGPTKSDGSVTWLQWSGKILSAPPTPTP
jgi:hypothetical protein